MIKTKQPNMLVCQLQSHFIIEMYLHAFCQYTQLHTQRTALRGYFNLHSYFNLGCRIPCLKFHKGQQECGHLRMPLTPKTHFKHRGKRSVYSNSLSHTPNHKCLVLENMVLPIFKSSKNLLPTAEEKDTKNV